MFRSPSSRKPCHEHAGSPAVVMAPLVVGPFYLSLALGLDRVLWESSWRPFRLVPRLTVVPAVASWTDWAHHSLPGRVIVMSAGFLARSMIPYNGAASPATRSIVVVTAGYALFQR